jgi:DNA-binding PadR family transcriptional regulator
MMTKDEKEKLEYEEDVMLVSRALREMQAHGYMESKIDPSSGKLLWRLTEKGRLASDEEFDAITDLYAHHHSDDRSHHHGGDTQKRDGIEIDGDLIMVINETALMPNRISVTENEIILDSPLHQQVVLIVETALHDMEADGYAECCADSEGRPSWRFTDKGRQRYRPVT